MKIITKLLEILKILEIPGDGGVQTPPPASFELEMNRWANISTVPVAVIAIFAWPMYIPLDASLYPNVPVVFYFRWGLTLVGLATLGLHFVPSFRKYSYWIIFSLNCYLALATSVILGLVGGDPIYMGGFSIVILTVGLMPIQRIHVLTMLALSLLIFLILGNRIGMVFNQPEQIYGLYNLVVSSAVSIATIYVFDYIRQKSYRNSCATWEANSQLKKANELKNQLLQIAANDLKDPLQVIILYTDLLKNKLAADRFAVEKLMIVHRSTDRMIKLIAGLLEITQIESGKLDMHRSDVDLAKVVEAAAKSHQQNAQIKNQQLIISAAEYIMIYGDEMLLRQVADHLISNAIKFSPPGKSIWIDVEAVDNHSSVLFKVRDEGPGLSEEDIDKVFSKFQQLSNKPTGGEISTGLGLAITRDLVALHGGTISVESEPGQGSTFSILMPLNGVADE